jgi:hypothetical protein
VEQVAILSGELPDWAASGDGYGDGSGSGSGSGYGYGYGYGYGDGSGSGSGSGDGEFWAKAVECFALKWPIAQQQRLAELQASGAKIAYWRSHPNGKPANGGSSEPVTPGLVQKEPGPIRRECGAGQLHATLQPNNWKGDRYWIVALLGEVRGDDEKYWALTREIIGECI